MELTIIALRIAERPVEMRLPFQFGATEVRHTAEALLELTARVDGREVVGHAAQLMVPRWFDKRPALDNAATIDELRETVRAAAELAEGCSGSVAQITHDLRAAVEARLGADVPRLAAGFGPALVEMALIDAACLAAGAPFWAAARDDLFGLAATCPPDLPADALAASLSRITRPTRIALRHTVGFDAPLTGAEVISGPRDGLPVSLQEVTEVTGIRRWKIKLKGDPEADLSRLHALAPIIDLPGSPAANITLDANEQYDPDRFRRFVAGLADWPLRERVRFVEQPFAREIALEARGDGYGLPLVIDESDDHDAAFAAALTRGWAGTSIKSCKGVLRALINRARADVAGALLSGEDLTVQPGLCWRQDTAMAAACGVPDVERNGHHFAGGMQGAPQTEVTESLSAHSDMFTAGVGGRPALRIENGEVSIASLDTAGFGNGALLRM